MELHTHTHTHANKHTHTHTHTHTLLTLDMFFSQRGRILFVPFYHIVLIQDHYLTLTLSFLQGKEGRKEGERRERGNERKIENGPWWHYES